MNVLSRLLLTGFSLGDAPVAPGTAGSLLPIGVAGVMVSLRASPLAITIVMVALAVVFSVVCLAWGGAAEAALGRKDPSQVVADEIAGQALALIALPWMLAGEQLAWLWNGAILLAAFAAFRFFDIAKPPPIMQVQAAEGGWGILVDDLIAGIYALIVTQAVARWILPMMM